MSLNQTELPQAQVPPSITAQGPEPWRQVCALASLGAGYWGQQTMAASPLFALVAFAIGGVLLYLAVDPGEQKLVAALQSQPRARERWEPWFAVALLVASVFLYTWRLDSLPQGAIYSEGFLSARSPDLAAGPYTPYDSTPGTNWPSMYHYQGAFFGKLLGITPAHFRLASAVYGLILVFAVWLAARQLGSPGTAAIVALLWLGFHYSFHFSRRFSPVLMCSMPAILSLALALAGMRTKRMVFFLGAGAVGAMGMHTYFPGRLVPVLFTPFLLWAWFQREKLGLARKHFLAVLLAFGVIASPVLIYSITKRQSYAGYVNENSIVTITGAKSIFDFKTYRGIFLDQAKVYLLNFHVLGEKDGQEDNTFGTPVLDPVMQVLAPLGLFVALLCLTRGVPAFLVLGFFLGVLPGVLIRMGVPPWPRRSIFAFPFAYLLAGLAIEHLRLSLTRGRWRIPSWIFFAGALALCAWLGQRMIEHYKVYSQDPQYRQFSNNSAWYANEEVLAHPKAKVLMADILRREPSSAMIIYHKSAVISANLLRDYGDLDPERENLILLAPWYEPNVPILLKMYPHAVVKYYRDPLLADDRGLLKHVPVLGYELYNPAVYLISVLVPAADAAAMRGLLDESPGGKGALQKVFAVDGLNALAGKSIKLGGDVLLDPIGATVTLRLPLPSLRVSIGGKVLQHDKGVWVPGGRQLFSVQGLLPAKAVGPLALRLDTQFGDLVAQNRVLPIHLEHGWRVDAMPCKPEGQPAPGKRLATWHMLEAGTLFNDAYGLPCPHLAIMTATLKATEKGSYHFRAHWPSRMPERVSVGGVMANDRWNPQPGDPFYGTDKPVEIDPRHPPVVRIEYFNRCLDQRLQGVSLQMQRPGQTQWEEVPWEWLEPK